MGRVDKSKQNASNCSYLVLDPREKNWFQSLAEAYTADLTSIALRIPTWDGAGSGSVFTDVRQ